MVNITMFGDGSQKTIITGSKNNVDGVPTFKTATFGRLHQNINVNNVASFYYKIYIQHTICT